jgi:hypothetical protein
MVHKAHQDISGAKAMVLLVSAILYQRLYFDHFCCYGEIRPQTVRKEIAPASG